MNDTGWKVSFHLVYPYLSFPCNNSILRTAATALNDIPQLGFRGLDGTDCRFVETEVCTRDWQFRLPLNHKLSDATCYVLLFPGLPTVTSFRLPRRLACVTCLEQET